jgi:hypothetical protein
MYRISAWIEMGVGEYADLFLVNLRPSLVFPSTVALWMKAYGQVAYPKGNPHRSE